MGAEHYTQPRVNHIDLSHLSLFMFCTYRTSRLQTRHRAVAQESYWILMQVCSGPVLCDIPGGPPQMLAGTPGHMSPRRQKSWEIQFPNMVQPALFLRRVKTCPVTIRTAGSSRAPRLGQRELMA